MCVCVQHFAQNRKCSDPARIRARGPLIKGSTSNPFSHRANCNGERYVSLVALAVDCTVTAQLLTHCFVALYGSIRQFPLTNCVCLRCQRDTVKKTNVSPSMKNPYTAISKITAEHIHTGQWLSTFHCCVKFEHSFEHNIL